MGTLQHVKLVNLVKLGNPVIIAILEISDIRKVVIMSAVDFQGNAVTSDLIKAEVAADANHLVCNGPASDLLFRAFFGGLGGWSPCRALL